MVSVDDVEKYCTYDTRVERAFCEYMFECFSFMFVLSEKACIARMETVSMEQCVHNTAHRASLHSTPYWHGHEADKDDGGEHGRHE